MLKALKFIKYSFLTFAAAIMILLVIDSIFYYLGTRYIMEEYLIPELSLACVVGVVVGLASVIDHDKHRHINPNNPLHKDINNN